MMTISYADGTETVPTNRRSSFFDRHYATGLESTVKSSLSGRPREEGACRTGFGSVPRLYPTSLRDMGHPILNLRRRDKMWVTRPLGQDVELVQ